VQPLLIGHDLSTIGQHHAQTPNLLYNSIRTTYSQKVMLLLLQVMPRHISRALLV
jgi:hypothetical protein